MLKKIFSLSILVAPLIIFGCAHQEDKNPKMSHEQSSHPSDELSLKADRSELDEQRRQIPEDVKRSNDELSLVLQLMQSNELGDMQDPSKIRDRFDKAIRDRREKLEKDVDQLWAEAVVRYK